MVRSTRPDRDVDLPACSLELFWEIILELAVPETILKSNLTMYSRQLLLLSLRPFLFAVTEGRGGASQKQSEGRLASEDCAFVCLFGLV